MEEGPEPHEVVERSVEHQHHLEKDEHGAGGNRLATTFPAVTAAVLAVFAALGSLLSGNEANQAILHQTQATDHWGYFQAKSTKGHLYEVGREIVQALAETQGANQADRVKPTLLRFQEQTQTYNREKGELEEQARALEEQSAHEFHKHHRFALGIAAFQVGIVLASISILVRYRLLWALSIVSGAAGLFFLLQGASL